MFRCLMPEPCSFDRAGPQTASHGKINKLAYYVQSLHKGSRPPIGAVLLHELQNKVHRDGPRFCGYELPVYAWRIAAAGARLCGPAGSALRHPPRAMGGAGQGRAVRGTQTVGTRRTDGDAADHADAFDRPSLRYRLD